MDHGDSTTVLGITFQPMVLERQAIPIHQAETNPVKMTALTIPILQMAKALGPVIHGMVG
jgi:hypothetical protein